VIREIQFKPTSGFLMLAVLFIGAVSAFGGFLTAAAAQNGQGLIGSALLGLVVVFCLGGFLVVTPNEARVLTLFGNYVGSIKTAGFWWANPFTAKRKLTLKVRNFETNKLKVNDSHSNPIEIAAVVVWRIVDTAEASFEVENCEAYVQMQSESALRSLASTYPYDAHGTGDIALSTHPVEVSKALADALLERLTKAGVQVTDARISLLSYAPEIAAAMLQRQQASAIVAARALIVEGAVGMVENALQMLSSRNVVVLDDERKAQMVSNLLTVLCGERGAQPVLNTGSIYQ
jgi:regulator of protease activity HflC (stomatin/prohibitin superfamily)